MKTTPKLHFHIHMKLGGKGRTLSVGR